MKRDDLIFDIIEKEHQRQLKGIELIASENFVSDQVMQAKPRFYLKIPFPLQFATNKKESVLANSLIFSGEGGIRTPGPVTVNGFQDRRDRPLCHLSNADAKIE